MKAEIRTISPDAAKEMLRNNTNNRPVNKATVRRYASDMQSGRWALNGETIIMNGGKLLDGQHRLMACVASGVSFQTIIVEGVASEAFATIDQGDKRTAGNVLAIAGIVNATIAAAAIRWVRVVQNSDGKKSLNLGASGATTSAYTLQFYRDHPEMNDSCRMAQNVYTNCKAFVPSILAAMHFLFAQKDKALADEFMNGLGSGDGLAIGDPRLTLRNRMIERGMKLHKERTEWVAVLHIYAWNAFREGRKLSKLSFREGDLVPKIV
jgi:hypothetical protein